MRLLKQLEERGVQCDIVRIYREFDTIADSLADQALDGRVLTWETSFGEEHSFNDPSIDSVDYRGTMRDTWPSLELQWFPSKPCKEKMRNDKAIGSRSGLAMEHDNEARKP